MEFNIIRFDRQGPPFAGSRWLELWQEKIQYVVRSDFPINEVRVISEEIGQSHYEVIILEVGSIATSTSNNSCS